MGSDAGGSLVVDSHAFIWYVQASPRLSDKARQAMDDVTAADVPLIISAITVVGLVYLMEKGTSPSRKPSGELLARVTWRQ